MDDNFQKYLKNKIKWTKFTCDVLFWMFFHAILLFLKESSLFTKSCQEANLETNYLAVDNLKHLTETIFSSCHYDNLAQNSIIALVIVIGLRLILSYNKNDFFLSIRGLYAQKNTTDNWNIIDNFLFIFIQWLPLIISVILQTFIYRPSNIFEADLYVNITFFTQFIWLSPIIFRFQGKNIPELIMGVTIKATEKKQQKILHSFNSTLKRNIALLGRGFVSLIVVVLIGGAFISLIQFARIPTLNPQYQKIVYDGPSPIWEDNIYFALEGLSAPENVTDYYNYGRTKALANTRLYEEMKRKNYVEEQYLLDIPSIEDSAITIDENNEISIYYNKDKSLECLYSLSKHNHDKCATYNEWQIYVGINKLVWDRFNKAPDLGTAYYVPPQIMGSKIINLLDLSELKAVQIIYLAEQGESDKAMREWLKFMSLYRAMANSRDSIVNKAITSLNISLHMDALEKLLFLEPNLAKTYRKELLNALKYDKPIFRDPYLLADDWSFIEPFTNGALGKAHAVQNDYLECIIGYKQLAETALDEFPFDKGDVNLCPLQEDQDLLSQTLIYPLMTEGSYTVNTIFSLLARGTLKGQGLLKSMKIKQVNFRVASLAVEILAQDLSAEEASIFVRQAPKSIQNPIINAPFIWDEDEMHLSYKLPNRDDFIFRLNLNKQK